MPVPSGQQTPHQLCEFPQFLGAEIGAASSHNYERIGRHHIRPSGRQPDQPPLLVVKVDPVLTPAMVVGDQLKLASEPGMVGMDDSKSSLRKVTLRSSR